MVVTVRLAAALRAHADGAAHLDVDVPGTADGDGVDRVTVGDVLDALAVAVPAVARRIRDEAGGLRTHVNVFVGQDNARDLGGLTAPVPPGAEVSVLPAVSGG